MAIKTQAIWLDETDSGHPKRRVLRSTKASKGDLAGKVVGVSCGVPHISRTPEVGEGAQKSGALGVPTPPAVAAGVHRSLMILRVHGHSTQWDWKRPRPPYAT